jgi:hypothetical protein
VRCHLAVIKRSATWHFGVEDNSRVHLFLTLSSNLMTRLVTTKIINFSFIITKIILEIQRYVIFMSFGTLDALICYKDIQGWS